MSRKEKVYAIYKGEKFIDVGTTKELTERLKMDINHVRWLATKENKKRDKGNRLVAYLLDELEEEE